jgi:holo-[acyl-carrier protein] synthase
VIYGIGTDLVSVQRIEDVLFRHGDRFLHRILSEAEVAEYAESAQPARFLAKRFAVKEAFSKAWGTGIGDSVGWHDIRVTHDGRGKPLLVPSPVLAAKFSGVKITATHVSLSDEADHAIAFVVLESELK